MASHDDEENGAGRKHVIEERKDTAASSDNVRIVRMILLKLIPDNLTSRTNGHDSQAGVRGMPAGHPLHPVPRGRATKGYC